MLTTVKFTLLFLALGVCRELEDNYIDDEEPELVAQESKYGSLWPLPQKVQISQIPLKLSGSRFRIVDAQMSSAGPSCNLLQNAYRR